MSQLPHLLSLPEHKRDMTGRGMKDQQGRLLQNAPLKGVLIY